MKNSKYILLPFVFLTCTIQTQNVAQNVSKPSPSELRAMIVSIEGSIMPNLIGQLSGYYDVELKNKGKIKLIASGNIISGYYQNGGNVIPLTTQEAKAYEQVFDAAKGFPNRGIQTFR
jgi:hypothetical protein